MEIDMLPDVGTNMTSLDKALAFVGMARYLPQFLSMVSNWYDVPLFYKGIKKEFVLKFRNGHQVKVAKLEDLLNVMESPEVQDDLIRSLEMPVEVGRNRVVFNAPGRELKFYYEGKKQLLNTIAAIKHLYFDGEYSKFDVEGKEVLDIGTNICDTGIYFVINGARKVYAFEPYPHSYRIAEHNVRLNGMQRQIELYNEGCGGRRGSVVLDPKYQSTGGDSLRHFGSGVKVRIRTLEDISRDIGLEGAALKLDCEGYEYGIVLRASQRTLRRFDRIVLEYHYGYLNLERKLRRSGFDVRHTTPRKAINCYAKGWKMTCGLIFATLRD